MFYFYFKFGIYGIASILQYQLDNINIIIGIKKIKNNNKLEKPFTFYIMDVVNLLPALFS